MADDDLVELEIAPSVVVKVARGAIAGRVNPLDAMPGGITTTTLTTT